MKRKSILALAVAVILASSTTLLCRFGGILLHFGVSDQPMSTSSIKGTNLTSPEQESSQCDALKSHYSGQWRHVYAPISKATFEESFASSFYFADEFNWLQGKNMPSRFDLNACKTKYENQRSSKMYVSKLGNQVRHYFAMKRNYFNLSSSRKLLSILLQILVRLRVEEFCALHFKMDLQ